MKTPGRPAGLRSYTQKEREAAQKVLRELLRRFCNKNSSSMADVAALAGITKDLLYAWMNRDVPFAHLIPKRENYQYLFGLLKPSRAELEILCKFCLQKSVGSPISAEEIAGKISKTPRTFHSSPLKKISSLEVIGALKCIAEVLPEILTYPEAKIEKLICEYPNLRLTSAAKNRQVLIALLKAYDEI